MCRSKAAAERTCKRGDDSEEMNHAHSRAQMREREGVCARQGGKKKRRFTHAHAHTRDTMHVLTAPEGKGLYIESEAEGCRSGGCQSLRLGFWGFHLDP